MKLINEILEGFSEDFYFWCSGELVLSFFSIVQFCGVARCMRIALRDDILDVRTYVIRFFILHAPWKSNSAWKIAWKMNPIMILSPTRNIRSMQLASMSCIEARESEASNQYSAFAILRLSQSNQIPQAQIPTNTLHNIANMFSMFTKALVVLCIFLNVMQVRSRPNYSSGHWNLDASNCPVYNFCRFIPDSEAEKLPPITILWLRKSLCVIPHRY